MRKLMSLVIAGLMLITAVMPAPASASAVANVSEEILNQYLIDAGYPQSFIDAIDTTEKMHLYEGQYVFESMGEVHGIFTENHRIEYSLNDDGTINIDNDNLEEFNKLIRDSNEVKKIVSHLELASSSGEVPTVDLIQERINEIQSLPHETALRSLVNWSAEITCSHKSYKDGVAKKHLTYRWKWSYDPVWKLTDKVAMAWSGNFTAEPKSVYWSYGKRIIYPNLEQKYEVVGRGYGYDDYNCNAGVAKAINLKGRNPLYVDMYHSGILSADLTKVTSTESRESAIGRYYHTQILAGLSLSFSSTGPSISVSSSLGQYEQSSDSAVAFWVTK
jgi:hypothetical protein